MPPLASVRCCELIHYLKELGFDGPYPGDKRKGWLKVSSG